MRLSLKPVRKHAKTPIECIREPYIVTALMSTTPTPAPRHRLEVPRMALHAGLERPCKTTCDCRPEIRATTEGDAR